MRMASWDGAAPFEETVVVEGRSFYTRLTYRSGAAGRIDVISMPRLPYLDLGGGASILATSLGDAMRAAANVAVDIAREVGSDAANWRALVGAVMQRCTDPSTWEPGTLIVDDERVPAMVQALESQTWAMVAELPSQFAVLAWSAPTTPESVALATVNTNEQSG